MLDEIAAVVEFTKHWCGHASFRVRLEEQDI
jgi:hypothetical protein